MCATTDGFKIAEKDLELRGPGDIEGTRQSGALNFKLASIVQDKKWLEIAREMAERLLDEDPDLVPRQQICSLKITCNHLQEKPPGARFRRFKCTHNQYCLFT